MNSKQKEKYDALFQASIDVMLEKGFERTTISEIAKKAGVANGTFYLYFKNKNDLIPAISEYIIRNLLKNIKENTQYAKNIWGILEQVIEQTFIVTKHYKELILLIYSSLAYDHSFDKWEIAYNSYYDWLENELKNALQRGEINGRVNRNIVKMIINSLELAAENYYFTTNEREENETKLKEDVYYYIRNAIK
ncbi:TetR family transcriptional regulator [Bacillus cereus]|uniref:TetR family transcriptional regulator n=1 Tax=Bacillus cereus TaxID=1396 RepID=A0A9X7G4A0_BACCE|nr:TetR family transcriptional regulator [Bacillus cereus]PED40210.1 TetR family transcriptional regulator [Bacillus cereus]PFU99146.1 TetR family transcriptional regulator [Bacillus cereus]